MVDSASCTVSALTEGLWSALLPLNPLKQPYTKPKSSFIPRKGGLLPATAPVKRWHHQWDIYLLYVLTNARLWIYHWTCILCSRYANALGSGPLHISQNSEFTRDMDLHRLSIMRKSPYRKISSQLQMRRCLPWLLPSTVLLKALRVVPRLPHPPNKLPVFKETFLAFTQQPLPVLCEPPLSISFPCICIQDRSKSLNFSGRFLMYVFFLPFFFLVSLQGSSQYHIQTNTYFHSIPLIILSIAFFSCSEFPIVTFSTLYTSFTAEIPLSFPDLVWVLHWKQRLHYTQRSTSSQYNRQFRQYFLRTQKYAHLSFSEQNCENTLVVTFLRHYS